MALDVTTLLPEMMAAAAGVLEEEWPEAMLYAESELKKLAETLALIDRLRAEGAITERRAQLHLEFQKSSMRTVLLTVDGLGVLAAERAINAALDVLRDTANTALGFPLI